MLLSNVEKFSFLFLAQFVYLLMNSFSNSEKINKHTLFLWIRPCFCLSCFYFYNYDGRKALKTSSKKTQGYAYSGNFHKSWKEGKTKCSSKVPQGRFLMRSGLGQFLIFAQNIYPCQIIKIRKEQFSIQIHNLANKKKLFCF